MARLPAPLGVDLSESVEVIDLPDGEWVEGDDGGVSLIEMVDIATDLMARLAFDANLAAHMDDDQLGSVSSDLLDGIRADLESRSEWEETYRRGLDLLGFKLEGPRDVPFKGASNVVLPVIGEAAVSFQARALSEFLPPDGPVRTKIVGEATPEKKAQARRVEAYSNYWCTEECEEYFAEHDQLFFALPVAGCGFKKAYWDETLGRVTSRYVPAEDLIVSYGASSLMTARVTHRFRLTWSEVRGYVDAGVYLPVEKDGGEDRLSAGSVVRDAKDEISGLEADTRVKGQVHTFYEVHCDMALPDGVDPLAGEGAEDGESGESAETAPLLPYIVVIHAPSGKVVSIRRNWSEADPRRRRLPWFATYKFLPSMSGVYGYGLVHVIGNLADAATSILRQIIDAGSFATVPSGFKASGLSFRESDHELRPGEFIDVDAPGGEIARGIMPLPFRGPDQTLYGVLQWLTDTARRQAAIADVQVGDLQPNAPVGSTLAVLDNADRIQSAIHRRIHQAQRREWKLIHRLFGEWMPERYPFSVDGEDIVVAKFDFDDRVDVLPVTDPNITSKTQRVALARAHLEAAMQAPSLHDMREVMLGYHEALGSSDPERIVPDRESQAIEGVDPLTEFRLTTEGKTVRGAYGQNHMAHIQALNSQMMLFSNNPAMPQAGAQVAPLVQALVADHQLKMIEESVAARLGLPVTALLSGQAQSDPRFAPAVAQALSAQQAEAQQQAQQQMMAQKQQQEAEAVRIASAVENAKAQVKAQVDSMLAQVEGQIDLAMKQFDAGEAAKDRMSREKMKASEVAQRDRGDRLDAATDRAKMAQDAMLEREEQASDERLIRNADKTGGFTHT